jgi:Uma2 family endonuclease
MSRTARPQFDNLAEFLEQLGDIPPRRICYDPLPGTASKRDLLRRCAQNGKRYELVNHTLVERPMGSPEAYLAARLIGQFEMFLSSHDLGFLYAPDSLIEILPDQVRGPDVCFVSWTKRPERTVPTEPISDLIPDLVVEILSPSNTTREMRLKVREYFESGVRLVWIIDPAKRSAEILTAPDAKTSLAESGTLDGGDVLPGFRLPLAKLFERLAKPTAKKTRKKK